MNLSTLIARARRTMPLGPAALTAILVVACSGTGAGGSPVATAEPSAAPAASSGSSSGCPSSQPDPLPAGETRTVTMETSLGTIITSIDGSLSPIAAGNFVALAECGFYDGVGFHRLVPGFVIQGGDPDGTGTGGPGYTIEDEPVTATYHRGTLAMARTQEPDSQGSQFFVVLDDEAAAALASYNTYAIFGEVTDGMDVVDAIAATPNSGAPNNAALDPITMDRVTVATP
jgi:peptidyl-prolyl cis-trans isomerase B (cyclophilin B)